MTKIVLIQVERVNKVQALKLFKKHYKRWAKRNFEMIKYKKILLFVVISSGDWGFGNRVAHFWPNNCGERGRRRGELRRRNRSVPAVEFRRARFSLLPRAFLLDDAARTSGVGQPKRRRIPQRNVPIIDGRRIQNCCVESIEASANDCRTQSRERDKIDT